MPSTYLCLSVSLWWCLQAYNAEKAGAKAIIVADYKDERLLTMAVPEDRPEIAALKNDITIPTALITEVAFPFPAMSKTFDTSFLCRYVHCQMTYRLALGNYCLHILPLAM